MKEASRTGSMECPTEGANIVELLGGASIVPPEEGGVGIPEEVDSDGLKVRITDEVTDSADPAMMLPVVVLVRGMYSSSVLRECKLGEVANEELDSAGCGLMVSICGSFWDDIWERVLSRPSREVDLVRSDEDGAPPILASSLGMPVYSAVDEFGSISMYISSLSLSSTPSSSSWIIFSS